MPEWFTVTVTSQQRTSFGTGGERIYLTRSHPFIPGSVLRGALAAAWLRNGGTQDEVFTTIFERGRFSPAFPPWAQVQNQSVSKCKYHRSNADHEEYTDMAFETLSAADKQVDSCGATREYLKGGCSQTGLLTTVTTELTPRKNTAKKKNLFARQMIESGTVFTGHIVVPDGTDTTMLKKIDLAYFGGRGSVLGRCTVSFKSCHTPLTISDTSDVVVRTVSPTILVDEAGLPSLRLNEAIKDLTGIEPRQEEVWASRAESGLASGWHAASGLPKPAEVALSAGAVAILRNVGPDKLRTLLDRGLGLRRSEGYGWVEVVDKRWQPMIEVPHPKPLTRRESRDAHARMWLDRLKHLQLDSAQTDWVAKKLQDIRAGQEEQEKQVDQALTEPTAGTLTPIQKDGTANAPGVRQLLLTIPDLVRNAIASELKLSRGTNDETNVRPH